MGGTIVPRIRKKVEESSQSCSNLFPPSNVQLYMFCVLKIVHTLFLPLSLGSALAEKQKLVNAHLHFMFFPSVLFPSLSLSVVT